MRTVIITDGRYRSAIAAARELGRAGYDVVVTEARADERAEPPVFSSRFARGAWIEGSVKDAEYPDRQLLSRYSPGYGDLALESQREFFRVLNVTKTIGVSLTEGCLMVPTKSVTAFIGMSKTDKNCILSGCEDCTMRDTCMYSRTE